MTEIEIVCKKNANFLLIDTSYYVFYRYFATLRWFTFQQPKDEETGIASSIDHDNLHENEAFVTAFKKHIKNELLKLQKKWKIPDTNIIFCNDCSRADIWRCQLYSGYKAGRVLATNFNKGIFPLFYKFLKTEKIHTIESNNLEADDIVWIVSQFIHKDDSSPESKIIIITNDNDYLQMKTDYIEIYNVQGKGTDLSTRSKGDPLIDLYIKICIGDTSDNIPPICTKLGLITAEKLARMTEDERDKWINDKGPECHAQYELNKTLISFTNIPLDLILNVYDKYTFIFE